STGRRRARPRPRCSAPGRCTQAAGAGAGSSPTTRGPAPTSDPSERRTNGTTGTSCGAACAGARTSRTPAPPASPPRTRTRTAPPPRRRRRAGSCRRSSAVLGQHERARGHALSARDEGALRSGDLRTRLAADLPGGLDAQVEAVDVGLGHAATTRVRGQPAVELEVAVGAEREPFAARAEPVALERQRYERAERVVELRDVHVVGCHVGVRPQP